MKLLHVCETILGGVSTHLNELVPLQCADLGAENVRLLVPKEHVGELSSVVSALVVPFARHSRMRGLFILPFALIKQCACFRPDLIHAHSTFAGVIVRLIAPVFRIPVVYCPHAWATEREQSKLARRTTALIERALSFLCARIVAVSQAERQSGIALGIRSEKIITVRNGLGAQGPVFTPLVWEDRRLKVLFVGRLSPQKGIDILLRAIEGLEDKISLYVIGERLPGDPLIDFQHYPHVRWFGWRVSAQVMAMMASCDVVVMPSRWEGLPYVALEAMRLKKPIIAARVGGLQEVVCDQETGFLFDSGDALTLRRLLSSLEAVRCAELGVAAEKRFHDSFLAEPMGLAMQAVYQDVLSGGSL